MKKEEQVNSDYSGGYMKKIIGLFIFLLVILVIIGCGKETDGEKFKKEYESLNGEVSSYGNEYLSLSIPKNNKIKYKTDSEIVDVIKNETAVIYFGFNSCPWCRSMVENLLDVTNELKIENVYYVDVKEIRDTLEFKNDKVVRTKSGTTAYYEILELLDDYLDYYTITDNNGNDYQTTEKRIYAPNVVVVKNGEVLGLTTGVSVQLSDPYTGINDDIKKQSYDMLYDLIEEIKPNNVCTGEGVC